VASAVLPGSDSDGASHPDGAAAVGMYRTLARKQSDERHGSGGPDTDVQVRARERSSAGPQGAVVDCGAALGAATTCRMMILDELEAVRAILQLLEP